MAVIDPNAPNMVVPVAPTVPVPSSQKQQKQAPAPTPTTPLPPTLNGVIIPWVPNVGKVRKKRASSPIRFSHEAFQKSILKQPTDKAARGAYADWLEENEPHNVSPRNLERLRGDLPMWVGIHKPTGKVLVIPYLHRSNVEAHKGNLFHATERDSRGNSRAVRLNGRVKLWKTRPDEFEQPVKFGLYDAFRISHRDAGDWLTENPSYEPQ